MYISYNGALVKYQDNLIGLSQESDWEVLMMYTGKKLTNTQWVSGTYNQIRSDMGGVGTSTFMTMTESSTGANNRDSLGDGQGLYTAFFNKKNITRIALVDGSSSSNNPTDHNNYLVYDLVESSGNESICDVLKRLDLYQKDNPPFHGNDTVWGSPSVLNHTAGLSGYSGIISASGGTGFEAYTRSGVNRGLPNRFCVMGINRESDNDIQALCAFWGNLNTGKGDAWRGANPEETFWSYWGDDFHTDSRLRRIGNQLQTAPGVSTQSTWTGDVYLMAF